MIKWILMISGLALAGSSGFFLTSSSAFSETNSITVSTTIPNEPGVTQTVFEFVTGDTDTITRTRTVIDAQRFTDTVTKFNTLTETVTLEVEGPRGPRGFQGEKGDKGDRGPQGEKGPPGPPGGLQCPDGFSAETLTLNAPGGQVTLFVCLQQ